MYQLDHDEVEKDIELMPLPVDSPDGLWPFHGRISVKGITIDLHTNKAFNHERKPQHFTVIGFDPNSLIDDGDGYESYTCIFEVPLTKRKVHGVTVYHPDFTQLSSEYQGMGIMADIYVAIIKTFGIRIVSGDCQSPGSVKLWNKLARKRTIHTFSYIPRRGWSECYSTKKGELNARHWQPYDYERSVCVAGEI